ncbi:MAG: hypothetical protein LBD11_00885 [Candidatus Peribacteria bacterium]|jgi:hypothetical protein|nr:hypothetical protein [Candidatus Peribacteria bacterium]
MYQLSYISSVVENEAEVFILFPDGNLFQIFPQSVVHFQEKLFLEI